LLSYATGITPSGLEATMSAVAASTELPTAGSDRDDFIDLCRVQPAHRGRVALGFTIVVWRQDGPSATSPLGFTDNLWLLTWLLQVMPVSFFVGGHAHLQLWTKLRGGPTGASCSGGCGGSWSHRWPCFWCGWPS
jgi:hypothetical protein